MSLSESEQPEKKTGATPPDASGQPADKGVYFPEFAKLEGEEAEFETVDWRHCDSGSSLDLETTYITKMIWDRKSLTMTNWRQLSELEALTLAQFTGHLTIWLDEETATPELQMHLCRVLAEHRGVLFLAGSASLTPEAATALLQHPGPIIVDVELDFHTVQILGTRHDVQIISDFW